MILEVDAFRKKFDNIIKNKPNTPDVPLLNRWDRIPLFVFDMYRSGCSCNHLLHGRRYAQGSTAAPFFQMFHYKPIKKDTGEVWYVEPVLFEERLKGSKVFGDIYLLSKEAIFDHDMFQSNQYIRYRKQIYVNFNDPETHKPTQTVCWIYLGMHKAWEDELKSGLLTPAELIKPKTPGVSPYYRFDPQHEKDINVSRKMSNM